MRLTPLRCREATCHPDVKLHGQKYKFNGRNAVILLIFPRQLRLHCPKRVLQVVNQSEWGAVPLTEVFAEVTWVSAEGVELIEEFEGIFVGK